ncbi:hypothetical protein [Pedobacter mucosus]|uniref:hypothetical protein n=1 Tax=Pedobacter mucosus TaxID=2895286 RepID=UPI001EE3E0C9|nr:hypothetical protein [Pedobacter mucosus]UKT62935.1 hypothetical protein LOK61_14310 [Pedobacter mucosus]
MENQVTNNEHALRLFFTEDVFLVEDINVEIPLIDSSRPVFATEKIVLSDVNNNIYTKESAQIPSVNVGNDPKSYNKEAEQPHLIEEPTTPKVFKFLGGNKKSALILVNDNLNAVSTEQGRELLRKIVKAVDLGTQDFAIVNYSDYYGTSFLDFYEFFKPQLMLSFGVEVFDLKLNLVWENEIIIHQNAKLIFAPNLHHLEEDDTAKRMLWKHLKKIK